MKHDQTNQVKTTSWKLVFAILLIVPFLFAAALSSWLGVSRESNRSEDIFTHVSLPPVALTEVQSFRYNRMFFARFRVQPEALAGFMKSLEKYERNDGPPREPMSFKLKRDWWDMEASPDGTAWDRGGIHLWRANSQPDLFYSVVELGAPGSETPSEGNGSEATKSGE